MKNHVRIVSAISTKDFSKIHWRFLHSIQPLHCNYCFGGKSYSQSWREDATNRSIHHVPLHCGPTSFSSSVSLRMHHSVSRSIKFFQFHVTILCSAFSPHLFPPIVFVHESTLVSFLRGAFTFFQVHLIWCEVFISLFAPKSLEGITFCSTWSCSWLIQQTLLVRHATSSSYKKLFFFFSFSFVMQ
jgi:hypothetical protein